jgi:hypothetical protein
MSDIAHRHVTRGSECVCGSDWNWIADCCSAVIPVPATVASAYENPLVDDYAPEEGFFECRKGHAFCSRH